LWNCDIGDFKENTLVGYNLNQYIRYTDNR
jgi:hypothetical protein